MLCPFRPGQDTRLTSVNDVPLAPFGVCIKQPCTMWMVPEGHPPDAGNCAIPIIAIQISRQLALHATVVDAMHRSQQPSNTPPA